MIRRTAFLKTSFLWLLLLYLCDRSLAFLSTATTPLKCQSTQTRRFYHPAVEGWEQKFVDAGGKQQPTESSSDKGPRVLSAEFEVHAATEAELSSLDVKHWPTWTTGDKEKWSVGNQVPDKKMPYGELSYVISGRLEIIPQSTQTPVIVSVGDFVNFPKGFVASWKVLEELTWHYYLY